MFSYIKGVILVFIYTEVSLNVLGTDDCPRPEVAKNTIIKSKESIKNGAELIGKETVESAKYCYASCCSADNCNVALMHYKPSGSYDEDGEEIIDKLCYLFACGSPSVCTYEDHSRYAIIKIDKPEKKVTDDECPPGVPMAMCADDPCAVQSCDAHQNAICKPNYCGGCHAFYYDENNNRLDCTLPVKQVEVTQQVPNDISNVPNEQSVTVEETDYEETPSESLPGIIKEVLPKPTEEPVNDEEDPYYQSDKRTWIGENKPTTTPFITTTESKNTGNTGQDEMNLGSVPLLVALIVCIILLIGLIYRFKCARRGKPKKFPVDDGDYLINGMYL